VKRAPVKPTATAAITNAKSITIRGLMLTSPPEI
jgi:hypothetical protein